MNRVAAALITLMLAMPACAEDPPATEASIRELLELTNMSAMMDNMYAQMENMMHASLAQVFEGKEITGEQRKIIEDMQTQLIAILKDEMSWTAFEPMVIDIYSRTFTEREVASMVEFYRTDGGKAVIAKMPLVLKASMEAAQGKVATLIPRIQQLQRDTVERLKATCTENCGG